MAIANGGNDMDKNEVLKILETAKDENGEVPMRLVRQAFEKLTEPCEDTISRQAAVDAIAKMMPKSYTPDGSHPADEEIFRAQEIFADCIETIEILPSAQPEVLACGEGVLNAQPEIVRCKDCKHFELDHFEKVGEFPVPIIVAHEICMKWSDGCRTSKDGWCFMGERRTDEPD